MAVQKSKNKTVAPVLAEWPLPGAAMLGSSVRARGIMLEIRARLPGAMKKAIDIRGAVLVLSQPDKGNIDVAAITAIVEGVLAESADLPVIPREIEDILAITTTERHRWLKDGRLQSAGTRTVKLRGRARAITFHVFDPRHVEDLLNRDLVETWREDDAIRAVENRRLARSKAALVRQEKQRVPAAPVDESDEDGARFKLQGWAEFERNGPLR